MKRPLAVGLICIALLMVAVSLRLWSFRPQERLLPDGSKLCLTGLKVGATNTFVHGRALEKGLGRILPEQMVRRLIPASGVHLWKFTLSRPTIINFFSPSATSLTAQFRLQPIQGQSKLLVQASFGANFRWVVEGEDGMPYVQEFKGFNRQTEGFFSYLSTPVFPRNSRRITFRIEERDRLGSAWTEVASFVCKNPAKTQVRPWADSEAPMTRRIEDMEFTLGRPVVGIGPSDTNDIWGSTVAFPLRATGHGHVQTNWSIGYLFLEDASGNADVAGVLKGVTNGWLIFETLRSLDPEYVWRINLDIGRDSGWPATNLCTVHLPVNSPGIITNFNGILVEVGTSYRGVSVHTKNRNVRLEAVAMHYRDGPAGTGPGTGTFDVTFAVDRNYHLEFFTKPKILRGTKQHNAEQIGTIGTSP